MSKELKLNRITASHSLEMKRRGEKITMLTAYDYPTSLKADEAGIDMILIGDSLGMVILGYESTLPVTMEEMIHHTKAVSRGAKHAMVIGDLPFMSYHTSTDEAVFNAGRLIKEAGAQGVKLEGGKEVSAVVKRISSAGIPVMAHLGLTPQSIHKLGGYKVQGRDKLDARRMLEDAKILEDAGAFSLVLECVPEKLAKEITESLNIPTIGIGAGVHCDGQVLVVNDMLGIYEKFTPKFVKKYANLNLILSNAFKQYIEDVKSGAFPGEEHSFH
ncbi:MAG: 3-methyl-2-oxobutanoate hydroxymethyltransferase [Deltaproteobacteria bacterium]|nr:3-methyl-2-oxobutanoate hydroxymethyltransferase [Deltaproteobacteria bacterium]